MRNTFMQCLMQEAHRNENIFLVVGDVGFSVIEQFQAQFPNRYLNAGIAEQNMIGVAAGLAMAGKQVVVYTIIPFLTMRCFEQIRVDLCYQQLPVKLVGVGGGFSYATAAASHHAIEDIAIMRCLPGMTVIAPGSKYETEQLTPQLFNLTGPSYMRLANNEELVKYPDNTPITIGTAIEIIPAHEYLIIATGNALDLGFQVCQKLRTEHFDIGLISMPTIKPLDIDFLQHKQPGLKGIFTIEEHNVIGGLGEAIARCVMETFKQKIIFKAFGVNDFYFHEAGSRAYLNEKARLSIDIVSKEIITCVDRAKLLHNHSSLDTIATQSLGTIGI